jgi:uncharacterized protein YbcI
VSSETISPEIRDDGAASRLLSDVSALCVRIYKNEFGRGPETARSYFAGPDAIVCVLEQTLTPVERSLADRGQHERLRDLRMFYQYATAGLFTEPVEQLTGRRVRAFLSSIDIQADVAAEMFLLGDPR